MSLSSGFFNSVDHDRLYNAEDMSRLFDGLIRDGVFASIGTCMVVKANTKMTVNVGIGRAWFNHTWTLNDSILPVTLEPSHVLWPRIDAVVLEVNSEENVRENSIKVVNGEPSTNPTKPTLTKSALVNQYPLAYITVPAAATEIRQADIENAVGTKECPFVSGILEVISIEQLIPQWKDILNRFVEENTANFNAWMNNEKTAYAQWLQSNKDDYNKLVKDQTTSYQTWFDGIKNNYTNWFASIKEAYDANWEAFQKWESDSKSDYTSWFDGVKSTYETNWEEFQAWETKTKDNFDAWYETIKNQLSGDVVAKINDRIDQLNAKMLSLIDASEGIVEDTVEAPIVLASADILENGYDIVSAGPKLLTGTISKYPGTAHNEGAYDATTQTVTFGSENDSGAFLMLNKYIYLKSSGKYTLSVDFEASAAISGAVIGIDVKGTEEYDKYITTLPAGKSTQTFDFTYNGTGLAFVCYATGMSGKTVKLSNMKILRNGVTEANYGLYQDTNSVHIGPDTKFPLYGLHSYEGNTTIISPANFEAYVVDQYNGKALLESAKLGVEAKREKVGLIKSDDKYLPDTIEAPLMVTGATRNLLNPTLATTTQNGVTCTNNGDGTYTLNGTATAYKEFIIAKIRTKQSSYVNTKFIGSDGKTANFKCVVSFRDSNGNDISGTSVSDDEIIANIPSNTVELRVLAIVQSGTTLSNVTLKPMLTTDLNATYDDFVPYSGYGYDIKTCGKNLFKPTLATTTKNGVTCTNNGDGTYTLNGTATEEAVFGFINNEEKKTLYKNVVGKTIKFLDGGFGTSSNGRVLLNIKDVNGNWWPKGEKYTGNIFEVIEGYDAMVVDIRINKGITLSNVIVKPMLTTDLDSTYDDFEPYTEGPTIHIDSSTQFPLMGLETMEGGTNIISPANIETFHADDLNGKYLLEMIKKLAESGGVNFGSTAPKDPKVGDIWIDPDRRNLLSVYNGNNWRLSSSAISTGQSEGAFPSKPYVGQVHYNPTNKKMHVYIPYGGSFGAPGWYPVESDDQGGVSVGATAPSNTKLLWIDTSSGGVSKYYNGSAWVATASVWG